MAIKTKMVITGKIIAGPNSNDTPPDEKVDGVSSSQPIVLFKLYCSTPYSTEFPKLPNGRKNKIIKEPAIRNTIFAIAFEYPLLFSFIK